MFVATKEILEVLLFFSLQCSCRVRYCRRKTLEVCSRRYIVFLTHPTTKSFNTYQGCRFISAMKRETSSLASSSPPINTPKLAMQSFTTDQQRPQVIRNHHKEKLKEKYKTTISHNG